MREYYVIRKEIFEQFLTDNSLAAMPSQDAVKDAAVNLEQGAEYIVFEKAGTIAPEIKARLNYKTARKTGPRKKSATPAAEKAQGKQKKTA